MINQDNINNKKALFERSIETQTIYTMLCEIPINGIITYKEIGEAVKYDIQENRAALDSARKIALRDNNIVFDIIMNVGLKRMDNSGILDSLKNDYKRIHNTSKRQREKLKAINIDELNNNEKIKFNTAASISAMLAHCSKPKTLAKLENKIKGLDNVPVLNDTLEYFKLS